MYQELDDRPFEQAMKVGGFSAEFIAAANEKRTARLSEATEFRKPWFRIVEVVDLRGRSLADIVSDVARKHGISLAELRGSRQNMRVSKARKAAFKALHSERPDLSSNAVATYFRRDPSTIRHIWLAFDRMHPSEREAA